MKKDLSEALRLLKAQLDQMSDFCDDVMEKDFEDIDEEVILEIERKYLSCKKRMLNAANGVSGAFINISKTVPANMYQ